METITVGRAEFFALVRSANDLRVLLNREYMDDGVRQRQYSAAISNLENAARAATASEVKPTTNA